MMTHDEMIAVITHHKNGGKVEYKEDGAETWTELYAEPLWNFAQHDYRAQHEPMVIWCEANSSGVIFNIHEKKPEKLSTYTGSTLKKFVEVIE